MAGGNVGLYDFKSWEFAKIRALTQTTKSKPLITLTDTHEQDANL